MLLRRRRRIFIRPQTVACDVRDRREKRDAQDGKEHRVMHEPTCDVRSSETSNSRLPWYSRYSRPFRQFSLALIVVPQPASPYQDDCT